MELKTLDDGRRCTTESATVNEAAQMGYGDIGSTPQKKGLGVTTGLAGLDRILNRDNSALVKAFDKKKGPWRPGMD